MLLFSASVEKKEALFLVKIKKRKHVCFFVCLFAFLLLIWKLYRVAADDFSFLDVCHEKMSVNQLNTESGRRMMAGVWLALLCKYKLELTSDL